MVAAIAGAVVVVAKAVVAKAVVAKVVEAIAVARAVVAKVEAVAVAPSSQDAFGTSASAWWQRNVDPDVPSARSAGAERGSDIRRRSHVAAFGLLKGPERRWRDTRV